MAINNWRREFLVGVGVNNASYISPDTDSRQIQMYQLQQKALKRTTPKRWKSKKPTPDTSNLPNENREDFVDKNWRLIFIKYGKDDYWTPSFFVKEWAKDYDGNFRWREYEPAKAEWNNFEIYNNIRSAKKDKNWRLDYTFKDNIFWDGDDEIYNLSPNAK